MVETVDTKPTLRRRIIDAADALIREHGLGGATTREIAKAAGCAEGSIYVHFEDKIDLVIAVIVEREPFFAELLELPSRAGENDVEDNLVPWVEELLQLLRDNQPIFFALMGDPNVFARFKERLHERETGPVAVFNAAAAYVRAEQQLGRLDGEHPARGGRLDPDRRLPRPDADACARRSRADCVRGVRAGARPNNRLRPRARLRARCRDSENPERRGGSVVKARIFADENRKWWTLGALAFALFMIMLDNTVVNVALPSIQRDLGIGLSQLEWTVNAYALTFAVLMLSGGKLADFFGRKRIFLLGLVVFTLSSLLCGLATSGEMLIGARTAQGVGAALMLPATLSIISATFPPQQRGTAIGIWAGVSAMALAIGPLIGGLITEHIDWSWIFFVNVPIGVLGVVVSWFVIRESRDTSADQRLDIPGLLASGIGLFALTFALIEANSYGWTDPVIIGLFALCAVALVDVRLPRATPALAAARPLALPQLDLRRRERRRPADHARDVRRVLLHVDLHAEHPRLLRDEDGCGVPADDDRSSSWSPRSPAGPRTGSAPAHS